MKTNQLPEPELGYIQTDNSNQPAFSARQIREAMKHAQQPATGEPVYQICKKDSQSISSAWIDVEKQAYEDAGIYPEYGCRTLYTRPAPRVPKDDQIAALVNKVRDIARMFHDHQSLRERIAIELVPALKASQEVKSNAERVPADVVRDAIAAVREQYRGTDWGKAAECICDAIDATMLAAKEGTNGEIN